MATLLLEGDTNVSGVDTSRQGTRYKCVCVRVCECVLTCMHQRMNGYVRAL